jgi:hypothetical protein
MLVLRRQVFKSGLPRHVLPSYRWASLLGSAIPANSKTVRRSRQFPRSAPSIAACTRSISFSCKSRSRKSRSGVFRSFVAGLFSGSVPRLAPWAALFRRSAAGSVVNSERNWGGFPKWEWKGGEFDSRVFLVRFRSSGRDRDDRCWSPPAQIRTSAHSRMRLLSQI